MTTNLTGMSAMQHFLRLSANNDMSTPQDNLNRKAQWDWTTDGTGKDQINLVWQRTLVVSYNTNIDLGLVNSLFNVFGSLTNFARVKSIYAKASSTNSNGVIICNSVSARFLGPLSASCIVDQNGGFMVTSPSSKGWAVVSGTNSTLRISNDGTVSGSNASVDFIMTGCSS